MSQRVAFFDVDGTLLLKNSGPLYARWLHGQGLLGYGDLLRSAYYMLIYKFDLLDARAFYQKLMARMEGEPASLHEERGENFFREVLSELIRPSMLEALQQHRENGDKVAILTASTPTLVAPLARHLNIDVILATRMEVDDDGLYTGKLVGEPCFGDGKRIKAEAFCQKHGLDMANAVAYADSMSDRPLLEAVGFPKVVDPDPLLGRLARKMEWPVLGLGERPAEEPEQQQTTSPTDS